LNFSFPFNYIFFPSSNLIFFLSPLCLNISLIEMSYDYLTPGVLKSTFSAWVKDPNYGFDWHPLLRVRMLKVRKVEKSKNGKMYYRCIGTDGEMSMHMLVADNTGAFDSGSGHVVTANNHSYRLMGGNKPIVTLSNFTIDENEYPPLDVPLVGMLVDSMSSLDIEPNPAHLQSNANPPNQVQKDEQMNDADFKDKDLDNAQETSAAPQVPGYAGASVPIVKQNLSKQERTASKSKSESRAIVPLKTVTPYNNRWVIKVRVADKSKIIHYNRKTTGKLFNVTFVDESGEIRATGFNEQVDNFYDKLELGKVYYVSGARVNTANKQYSTVKNEFELMFDRSTHIEPSHEDDNSIPVNNYNFVPLDALSEQEANSTVDVLGVLTDVQEVTSITTKKGTPFQKRDISLVDDTGFSIRATLWGDKAAQFDSKPATVIAIKGAKINEFNGRSLSLLNSSSLVPSPDIPESHLMSGWYDSKGKSQDFQPQVDNTAKKEEPKRITLETVLLENLGHSDEPDYFSVKAMAAVISQNGTLYYPSCPDCRKKLVQMPDSTGWSCENCNKVFEKPFYRYVLSVCLNDETDQIWASAFEESGNLIVGATANELAELDERDPELKMRKLQEFPRLEYIFRIRAKQDIYNEVKRVRFSIVSISKLDYAAEAHKLINDLDMLN
jgi:replication factor A1